MGRGNGGGASAPSVDGVRVGWLPDGVRLVGVTKSDRIGHEVVIGQFEGGNTIVRVTVQRDDPDATLQDIADAYGRYYAPSQLGRIALRGTEAVTLNAPAPAPAGAVYEATWAEGSPSVVLTVGGSVVGAPNTPSTPLPVADLRRVAESLTVGPAPKPTPWQRLSEPLIRTAFAVAINSSQAPPQIPLAAVENGRDELERGRLWDHRSRTSGPVPAST